jgi:Protein of unknown function (DUF1552)
MIIQCKKSRRQFLIDATGAFLALPFLSSWGGMSQAYAEGANATKFISILLRNGYHGSHFFPQIARSQMTAISPSTRQVALPEVISPILGSSFTPIRDKILIYRGLDYLCSGEVGHALPQFLSSRSGLTNGPYPVNTVQPSIDYFIANQVYGNTTPFRRIVNTSIDWYNSPGHYSWGDVSNGQVYQTSSYFRDVAPLWTSLFTSSIESSSEEQRRKNLNVGVVDRVMGAYRDLKNDTRLSAADKLLVDQHLAHLTDLEVQIRNAPITSCTAPDRVDISYGEAQPLNYRAATRTMIDMIVVALSCGLTNVVNFSLNPDTMFRGVAPFNTGHHDVSHNTSPDGAAVLSSILNELFGHIAYLITKLDQLGLMNGLVGFVGNEIGNQCSNTDGTPEAPSIDGNHAGLDAMCLLFGDPTILNTGKYVWAERGIRGGRWHNGFSAGWNEALVSVMDLFGISAATYELPGITGYGSYLAGANFSLTNADVISPLSVRGKPLLGFRKLA